MKKNTILTLIKKLKIQLISSGIITILLFLIVTLFIKYFYKILLLLGEDTLGTIFSQLKDSTIMPLIIIPFVIFFFITNWILKFNYNNSKVLKVLFVISIYILSFIVILVLSILLSKVNGVLFIDVLVSLLKNMEGLGL